MTIQSENLSYSVDGTEMNCHLAWDDAQDGPRPGVLVFPEWWGLNEYIQQRTEQVASLGYVAMGVDMYGGRKSVTTPDEAGALMTGVLSEMGTTGTARVQAALDALGGHALADSERLGAIGYCFGGALVLHMARKSMPLKGVVSFHGALDSFHSPRPGDVKAEVLVCHGAADELIPYEAIPKFRAEMDRAGADFKFIAYEGALHGFTNPAADERGRKFNLPLAYDPEADAQSWEAMKSLFEKVF